MNPDMTLRLLEASVKIAGLNKTIEAQRQDINFLQAQIEFLETKILRLTTPPVRMMG